MAWCLVKHRDKLTFIFTYGDEFGFITEGRLRIAMKDELK
jgi:hypothetical protein